MKDTYGKKLKIEYYLLTEQSAKDKKGIIK